jgi:hypothetical protein
MCARLKTDGNVVAMQRFHCRHMATHRRAAGEAGLCEQAPAGRDTQRVHRTRRREQQGGEEGEGGSHVASCGFSLILNATACCHGHWAMDRITRTSGSCFQSRLASLRRHTAYEEAADSAASSHFQIGIERTG